MNLNERNRLQPNPYSLRRLGFIFRYKYFQPVKSKSDTTNEKF